jgi:hypothetical protein
MSHPVTTAACEMLAVATMATMAHTILVKLLLVFMSYLHKLNQNQITAIIAAGLLVSPCDVASSCFECDICLMFTDVG